MEQDTSLTSGQDDINVMPTREMASRELRMWAIEKMMEMQPGMKFELLISRVDTLVKYVENGYLCNCESCECKQES